MEKKDRLMSLDALRGVDMCFIMGLAPLIVAICKWWGMPDCWLVHQMRHVEWIGLAQHDTIFPTFLFIAGVSWPFSYASQVAKGVSLTKILLRIFKRGLLLFILGLFINFRGNFEHLRIPGVLQFIGLSWMFSALLYVFVKKIGVRIAIAAALLVGYWSLLAFVTAPDAPKDADSFSYLGNISGWLDRRFLEGHTLGKCDPEGFLSLMSGTCTAMYGVFAGEIVRSAWDGRRKVYTLLGFALGLLVLGFVWQPWCPCIKKLWTPTFGLFVGAYAAFFFALFYWICDVLKYQRWTYFFRVIGMNSITIYLGQSLIGFSRINNFIFGGIAGWLPKEAGAVLLGIGYMAVCWCFLWYLERKNVHLRV